MATIVIRHAKAAQPRKEAFVNYQPTHDQIERRAYQIFLDRGARPGNELDDWLRAECELEMIALYVRSWNRLSILDSRQLQNFEDCDDGQFESQVEILADSGRKSLDRACLIQRSPNLER
jgi:hypothetical protein